VDKKLSSYLDPSDHITGGHQVRVSELPFLNTGSPGAEFLTRMPSSCGETRGKRELASGAKALH
jgi:hypothetical protein